MIRVRYKMITIRLKNQSLRKQLNQGMMVLSRFNLTSRTQKVVMNTSKNLRIKSCKKNSSRICKVELHSNNLQNRSAPLSIFQRSLKWWEMVTHSLHWMAPKSVMIVLWCIDCNQWLSLLRLSCKSRLKKYHNHYSSKEFKKKRRSSNRQAIKTKIVREGKNANLS